MISVNACLGIDSICLNSLRFSINDLFELGRVDGKTDTIGKSVGLQVLERMG